MSHLEKLKPLSLLLLRCGLAVIFFYHGYPKATHLQQTAGGFAHMGLPPYFAYIAAVLEVVGSLLLVLGVLTRLTALLFTIEMAVALLKVHLPSGPITVVHNYELPLIVGLASFALSTVGAGALSIDYAWLRNRA